MRSSHVIRGFFKQFCFLFPCRREIKTVSTLRIILLDAFNMTDRKKNVFPGKNDFRLKHVYPRRYKFTSACSPENQFKKCTCSCTSGVRSQLFIRPHIYSDNNSKYLTRDGRSKVTINRLFIYFRHAR